MSELLKDPMFFYAIAFAIFVALAVKYGRVPLLGWLDGEIAAIRAELDQARALRKEAEDMLAAYKVRHDQAMKDAAAIVKQAEEDAVEMKRQAEVDLKAALARQEQEAAARIALAESEAIEMLRAAAVDAGIKLAAETLSGPAGAEAGGNLAEQAVVDVTTLVKAKSKAA